MAISTPARRARAALRTLSPQVITLALALVLGGAGGAAAANGGSLILGKANTETATATLSNTKGAPLKLTAPAGAAPLQVNRQTMITNLNAELVGGLHAADLETTGSAGGAFPGIGSPINASFEVVASTGRLPAGTYYVVATAEMEVAPGDLGGFCFIETNDFQGAIREGGDNGSGTVQAAEATAWAISGGDFFEEVCGTGGFNGSTLDDAGVVAIRVPASLASRRTGAPRKATLPGPARLLMPAHRPGR